jgi:hypothetical protein
MSALSPGFYPEIDAKRYHADDLALVPSLSSLIAKVLVDQTSKMAWLAHPRLNPAFKIEYDDKFNLGDAVHDWLSSGGARVRLTPVEREAVGGVERFKAWKAQVERNAADAAREDQPASDT